jgi:nicotinamidase/pyrazinamidase
MKRALVIVDMQYDLCDGGSQAHKNSLEIIPIINRIKDSFDYVIFTKEWHPDNHSSFKKNGGKLPKHCVENTYGSEIHKDIILKNSDIVIIKGYLQNYDTTSVFYVAETIEKPTKIKNMMRINKINHLYFCGNGIDGCIFSSCLDALISRFQVTIIKDAISFMHEDKKILCEEYLKSIGVIFMESKKI